jgi:hypothetical protein
MARTIADITPELESAYPTLTAVVNGEATPLPSNKYNERILQMALAVQDAELAAEAEAARRAERDQVRSAITSLDTHIANLSDTPTNAEVVAAVLFACRAVRRIIVVLIQRGVVEAS